MAKALLALVGAFLAAIVAAKLTFDATTPGANEPVNEPWVQNKMEFVSWNNEQWTAWIHDDAFEQTPQAEGYWHRHSNPSLAFIDWEGEPWQAKIDGETFLLAHRGEWNEPTESATAIRYRDWSGRKQLRTLAQLTR